MLIGECAGPHLDVLAEKGCKEQSKILDEILNLGIICLIISLTNVLRTISHIGKTQYLSLMG